VYRPDGRLTLPEGVSNLQIDYTAPSFTAPERVAFRYRLKGLDKNWVDAGGRRQAFYTNLSPGHYRFQVTAANNDGVWNRGGAEVDIEIPPTFLQSKLFAGLCAAAALGILWLLYNLRIRQIAWRLRLRLNARIEERERIARELHDTLLQSVQGLIFRFQAIAAQIAPEQPARKQMECALDQADELLAEGRDRLNNLRAVQAAGDLAELFSASATRILAGTEIAVSLSVEGTQREISAPAAEEIMRIGDEFLFNTLKHAEARKVGIAINYGRKNLTVHLDDDGRGIDAAILEQGGREGHFGLRGMRERTQKIGGNFTLMSRPGAGVELTITIPASVAYPRSGQNRREARTPNSTNSAKSRV
jgi:signal transduction histidine kinase